MYVAYGLYIQDFTMVIMNQTTKVTFVAWAVSDYFIKKNITTQMRLARWKSDKSNKKWDGKYENASSESTVLEENLADTAKANKLAVDALKNELKKVELEPELLRAQLLENFPKVNYSDKSKMSEEQVKLKTESERKLEDLTIRTIENFPNTLEYMSYNFTFIGICGPYVNYRDFYDFIYLQKNYSDIKNVTSDYKSAFISLIICHVIFLGLGPY